MGTNGLEREINYLNWFTW